MKPTPFHFSSLPCVFALVVIMAAAPSTARAVVWEKIVSDSGRTVEIDTSGIFTAEHGTKVSWGRIVLNDSEVKQAGYRTIKALNRYNCFERSFTTIKRVYLDNGNNILREEVVPTQQPVTVRNNSIDEQIWSRVCGLPIASAAASKPKPGNRSKPAPNAMSHLSKLANTADLAAWNTLQPTEPAQVVPNTLASTPPKSVLLTASVTPAATDSTQVLPIPAPPEVAPATPELVPPPPILFKPIPMPGVLQKPAVPIVPKHPEQPAVPQSQKKAPEPSPALQRGSVTQPLILPAPATRSRPRTPAQQPVLLPPESSWGYSGAAGPEFWGRLRPEWNLCAEGKRQSPIDFMVAKPVPVNLDPVKTDYRPSSFVVINGPQQLRIKVTESMGMEVRGQRYVLEGFTLHRPAETRIDGKIADMEAHFFHRDDKGRGAVLAVQFVRGTQPSAPLQTLLNNLPLEKGDSYAPQTRLDMAAFLPPGTAYYLYMGSLTTPPCTEGILWVVMKEPMTLSDGQYEVFSRLHADNARPPQPAFDRLILESH